MKLFINEKNNWTKDEFEILDEKGKVCYTADGDGLKQESKLHIYD